MGPTPRAGRDPYFEPLPHPRSDRSPPARVIGRESHRLRRPAAAAGQRAAHLGRWTRLAVITDAQIRAARKLLGWTSCVPQCSATRPFKLKSHVAGGSRRCMRPSS